MSVVSIESRGQIRSCPRRNIIKDVDHERISGLGRGHAISTEYYVSAKRGRAADILAPGGQQKW
jgi:hypothetical protein